MQTPSYGAPPPPLAPQAGPEPVPTVDLLVQAWRTNFANLATFLPLVAIQMVIVGIVIGAQVAITLSSGVPRRPITYSDTQWFFTVAPISLITTLFVFPFYAAIYKVSFNVLEGLPNPLQGLNAFIRHYLPCAGLGIFLTAVTMVVEFFTRSILGMFAGFANSIIATLIHFPFLFVIAAMVRFEMPLGEAIQYSFRRVGNNPLSIFGYYVGASIMAVSGIIACCFGVIFTACIHEIAIALLMTGLSSPQGHFHSQTPYPRYGGPPPA